MSPKRHLFNEPKDEWPRVILEGVITLFETVLPGRVQAVFELGSHSEDMAATVSDIDAFIVLKGDFQSDRELTLVDEVLAQCRLISPYRLDIDVIAEKNLRAIDPNNIRVAKGGRLVYGTDNRTDWWPPIKLDAYKEHIWAWSAGFVRGMHHTSKLCSPLKAPNPQDRFLGYTKVHRAAWYPFGVTEGTKELVASVCWVATAKLAAFGIMAKSRGECLDNVRGALDGHWSDLVLTLYDNCKSVWDYRVPSDEASRQHLEALCHQSLHFFEEFVTECPEEYRAKAIKQ